MTTTVIDTLHPQSAAAPSVLSDESPIIFLHLLKTGGTAFHSYLRNAFAPDQIISADELGTHEGARQALHRLESMTPRQRSRLKVIFGHQTKEFRRLFLKAPYMTILRDPFERAMSQYIYERHCAASLGLKEADRPLPEELELEAFMKRFSSWLSETSAFELQARGIADFLGIELKDISLENAAQIVEKFSFIGIQSQSALSVFLLNRHFGLPLKAVPVRFSFSGLTKQYFPQEFVREVRTLSALDAKLFDIAQVRLDGLARRTLARPSEWTAWNSFRALMEKEVEHSLIVARTASNASYGSRRGFLAHPAVRRVLGYL